MAEPTDSIRWPLVDRRGRLDFTSARPLLDASRRHGITVIWDLFHYGYPEDLDPLSVHELEARIALLEAEIARVKAKLANAVNFRASADELFRK